MKFILLCLMMICFITFMVAVFAILLLNEPFPSPLKLSIGILIEQTEKE